MNVKNFLLFISLGIVGSGYAKVSPTCTKPTSVEQKSVTNAPDASNNEDNNKSRSEVVSSGYSEKLQTFGLWVLILFNVALASVVEYFFL